MTGISEAQGSSSAVQGTCQTTLKVLCPDMEIVSVKRYENDGTGSACLYRLVLTAGAQRTRAEAKELRLVLYGKTHGEM